MMIKRTGLSLSHSRLALAGFTRPKKVAADLYVARARPPCVRGLIKYLVQKNGAKGGGPLRAQKFLLITGLPNQTAVPIRDINACICD